MNLAIIISITIVIILLGLVSIHRDKREIHDENKEISDFLNNLSSLVNKIRAGQNCDKEYRIFVANSQKMSKMMGEWIENMPIMELEFELSKGHQPDDYKLFHVYSNAAKIETSSKERVEGLNKQRYNLFTLYYRGVGLCLEYIFGYLVKLAYPKLSFKSKAWEIVSIIVSLLTVITDIVGIVLFFKK